MSDTPPDPAITAAVLKYILGGGVTLAGALLLLDRVNTRWRTYVANITKDERAMLAQALADAERATKDAIREAVDKVEKEYRAEIATAVKEVHESAPNRVQLATLLARLHEMADHIDREDRR